MNLNPDQLHIDLEKLWSQLSIDPPVIEARPIKSQTELATRGEYPLDSFQAEAAAHFGGPMRVLAPAGSGKTRTLTARINSLIGSDVSPEKILALAFNRKAAREMEERLARIGVAGVQARTLHSLGYEIVRSGLGWQYSDNAGEAYRLMVLGILKNYADGQFSKIKAHQAAPIFKALNAFKSNLVTFANMEVQLGYGTLALHDVFKNVIDGQQRAQLLTFPDMIYFALRVLIQNDLQRRTWQRKFDFLLVDEFQDLASAQMLLLRILALPQNNLFVVGDDDQLIYAWRGARVTHILEFEKMYPSAKTVVLGTNYRSALKIVRHAGWLIAHNHKRVAKNIRARPDAPRGILDIHLGDTPKAQAEAAVNWMQAQRRQHGIEWDAFGLLHRANEEAHWLVSALEKHRIPYTPPHPATPEFEDEPPPSIRGCASLLTIHKVKGKEFPFVVYFNLARGGGFADAEPDERRVAYVGITRAQSGLLVTAPLGQPSKFLLELALDPNLSDYALPYLERQLKLVRRQRNAETSGGGVGACLRTVLSELISGKTPKRPEDTMSMASATRFTELADLEDRLETEIRFRLILRPRTEF